MKGLKELKGPKGFKGVYDRESKCVITFSDTEKGTKEGITERIPVEDEELRHFCRNSVSD